MIPKTIHYCWFGRNEKPKLAQKCIASWKKHCPDYEIIEWNEDNFDPNFNAYTRYCYKNKKWAFLSDFVRLHVVCEHGGIYFDTDVELITPLDSFLRYNAFYAFETPSYVATGLGFASTSHHPIIKAMRQEYLNLSENLDGTFDLVSCPTLNTNALLPLGLKLNGMRQNVCGAEILPIDFMNPFEDTTGRLNKTENTISIHWYSKSWLSKRKIVRSALMRPLHRIFGVDAFKRFRK